MEFGYLGINYKNAGMDVRDKTSFTDMKKTEFMQLAADRGIEQCMILSTCNRSEVYFFFEEEQQFNAVRQLYETFFSEAGPGRYLTGFTGEEALAYLFRITAGLESLVLGEDQILGQVRDALDFARTMGYAKKELNKVVRDAVTCAKRIKTELKISEKPLSVSYVGIRKLDEAVGIKGRRALVIGSGNAASLALKYLYDYGAQKICACSRTAAHAHGLKKEYKDIEVVEYEDRYRAMERCDIVISATSSPHQVIKKEHLPAGRPLVFLDLAAPRDIDTKIGEMPEMRLINLDTLQRIVDSNKKERERLVEESRKIIAQDLRETIEWIAASRMDSTIESLQQRCSAIVEDSYAYLNRKMELSGREQKLLKKVLHASLQRFLREPIQEMKQLDTPEKQEEYRRIVNHLFQI